jgi:hypothetical protein
MRASAKAGRPKLCSWEVIGYAVLFSLQPAPAVTQRADTIVKVADKPVHAGVGRLVPEISIGVIEGADEYMFGDVADIALARDGSIYVYDRQVPAIRKYDANGKFVRTIGRKGRGPGEYLNGGGLAVGPDGKVYLWDTGNWRVNVYSAAGESIGSLATPSGADASVSMTTSRALVVDTAGLLYYRKPLFNRRQTGGPSAVIIRMRADGTVIDTIPVPDFSALERGVQASTQNATVSAPVPFSPVGAWTISPLGYVITGFPGRYAVDLRIPQPPGGKQPPAWKPGQTVVSLRRNVQPAQVTNAERDEEKKKIEERMKRTDPGWDWGSIEIPKTKPFYTGLQVGLDGRVWVPVIAENSRRAGGVSMSGGGSARGTIQSPRQSTSTEKPRPALYDVFEPAGIYVGQVQIPARVSTFVRRGYYIWGVEYDEDDVATVKRYRIEWR